MPWAERASFTTHATKTAYDSRPAVHTFLKEVSLRTSAQARTLPHTALYMKYGAYFTLVTRGVW